MIKLFFVGDGHLDGACVPRLVEGILKTTIDEQFKPWARLTSAERGYYKKARFAYLQAIDANTQGLVLTVDRDRDARSVKLAQLRDARESERNEGRNLPFAVGEANPHLEAWLHDDPAAVCSGLRLPKGTAIPTGKAVTDPKSSLEHFQSSGNRCNDPKPQVWGDIARAVDPNRCKHQEQTGFKAFRKDVESELGRLVKSND